MVVEHEDSVLLRASDDIGTAARSHDLAPVVVMTIAGTRPEGIKVAPVVRALSESERFRSVLVSTGQHTAMLDQVLDDFAVAPDIRLSVSSPGQDLAGLTSACLLQLGDVMRQTQPEVVLVQGDTTSALSGCLAAFYLRIPVVHLEAGLRTGNLLSPHPEEGNRRLITHLADLHLAPTEECYQNLIREDISTESVTITGNTVIDALRWMAGRVPARLARQGRTRMVLVTAHRRESWGEGLSNIANAVRQLAAEYEDVEFLLPLHGNPNARAPFVATLTDSDNVELCEPLSYKEMVSALHGSYLVLTDSGGLQEEAPSFGKPVLVTRETTERPEAVKSGCVRLVGTDQSEIVSSVRELLNNFELYEAMARSINPYGDGKAAERVLCSLLWRYRGATKPIPFSPAT